MNKFLNYLKRDIQNIKDASLYKEERVILGAQDGIINSQGKKLINMCSNNYLGFANNQELKEIAKKTLDTYGYGLASVRFICGTQDIHKKLEKSVSEFLLTEDTILYSSCFDANTGLFETLFNEEDIIISDSLNHASLIDGIRLCKAKRFRYKNRNLQELEEILKKEGRFKVIVTDGVFSMDGYIAPLKEIIALAKKYNAITVVDESHSIGVIGKKGAGTTDFLNIMGEIDIITGTFGKALGGANGGFTSGKKEVIEYLRQKSRPYLFSNTLNPPVVQASLKAVEILKNKGTELMLDLQMKTSFFREEMKNNGFDILEGQHSIVPIMFYDAHKAVKIAEKLFQLGVYVIPFSYPVVPQGQARIRVQISTAHTKQELKKVIKAFLQAKNS